MSTVPAQTKKARKAVLVPEPGDYLTDGTVLVEVVSKVPEGYRARLVTAEVEDPRTQTLTVSVVQKRWRKVKPEATDA